MLQSLGVSKALRASAAALFLGIKFSSPHKPLILDKAMDARIACVFLAI